MAAAPSYLLRLTLGYLSLLASCCRASSPPFDVHARCPRILTPSTLHTSPPANGTLRVMVPWYVGFEPFVRFRPDSCVVDGFSVQVFLSALRYMHSPLPPPIQFVLLGDGHASPPYDDMVDMLHNKTVDAVVADLTITSERMEKVGFTLPYMPSSLAIAVPIRYGSARTLWDFLTPFSWQLWSILFGFFMSTGIVLYFLESENPDFHITTENKEGSQPLNADSSTQPSCDPLLQDLPVNEVLNRTSGLSQTSLLQENQSNLPTYSLQCSAPVISNPVSHRRRIMNVYWEMMIAGYGKNAGPDHKIKKICRYASLCVFQSQQGSVRTNLGRIVTVIWLFVMLIFDSSYTASLASLLSAQKRYPAVDGLQALQANTNISVGYLGSSLIGAYIKKLGLEKHTFKLFAAETQYIQALQEEKHKSDGLDAFLEELPYIQFLLQSECDFMRISDDGNQLPTFGGFGFAFQKGDPMIDAVSQIILQMGEDGTLQVLKNGWKLSGAISSCKTDNQQQSLTLMRFGGLLAIIGCVYILCTTLRLCTRVIKYPEKMFDLLHALPGFQGNSMICRQVQDISLNRHSNRVCDESQQYQPQ